LDGRFVALARAAKRGVRRVPRVHRACAFLAMFVLLVMLFQKLRLERGQFVARSRVRGRKGMCHFALR
jgi:hypothetical protein